MGERAGLKSSFQKSDLSRELDLLDSGFRRNDGIRGHITKYRIRISVDNCLATLNINHRLGLLKRDPRVAPTGDGEVLTPSR